VNRYLAEITDLVRRKTGIALPAARETAILAAAGPGNDLCAGPWAA
jgi:hypothetical protein